MLLVTGTTWEDMGDMQWELVGFMALAWAIVGTCLARGIRTTGNIVYFTALFPYVVMIILFFRGESLIITRKKQKVLRHFCSKLDAAFDCQSG